MKIHHQSFLTPEDTGFRQIEAAVDERIPSSRTIQGFIHVYEEHQGGGGLSHPLPTDRRSRSRGTPQIGRSRRGIRRAVKDAFPLFDRRVGALPDLSAVSVYENLLICI